MSGIAAADIALLLWTVVVLVVLEGLLSADNALVLAVMVRHLPKPMQKRALRYGMIGAFFFRAVAVLFASTLLHYWILKAVGGVYLLYMAVAHLAFGNSDDGPGSRARAERGFWMTVLNVELTDIVFSVDSILAAVATAEALPDRLGEIVLFPLPVVEDVNVRLMTIYVGGVLGIIAMRFVAGYFLVLLDRFKGLEWGAYYLVGWIGLKLLGGGLNDAIHPGFPTAPGNWRESIPAWLGQVPLEMPAWFFWIGMAAIIAISMLVHPHRHRHPLPPTEGGEGELVESNQAGE